MVLNLLYVALWKISSAISTTIFVGIDTDNAHTKAHREGVRSKRSSTRKYIETATVVCPDVFAFHGNGTEQYVKNVLIVVS